MAEERLITPLRIEVVRDDEERTTVNRNLPTSGLRLPVKAEFKGSRRPGKALSITPCAPLTTVVALVDEPPGRSTNVTRAGNYEIRGGPRRTNRNREAEACIDS